MDHPNKEENKDAARIQLHGFISVLHRIKTVFRVGVVRVVNRDLTALDGILLTMCTGCHSSARFSFFCSVLTPAFL